MSCSGCRRLHEAANLCISPETQFQLQRCRRKCQSRMICTRQSFATSLYHNFNRLLRTSGTPAKPSNTQCTGNRFLCCWIPESSFKVRQIMAGQRRSVLVASGFDTRKRILLSLLLLVTRMMQEQSGTRILSSECLVHTNQQATALKRLGKCIVIMSIHQ